MDTNHESNQYCNLNDNTHIERVIKIDDFPFKVISEESSDHTTGKKLISDEKEPHQNILLNSNIENDKKIHIKKNFSQDIFDKIKKKESNFGSAKNIIFVNKTPEINPHEEIEDDKTRIEKITQQILISNREDMKQYESLITPELIRPIKCIDLNTHYSSEDEQTQKQNIMKESFKSCSSHKNFLVKVNMIGNPGAGKTEFVNIITNNKKSKQNINQAKKAMKFSNKILKKYPKFIFG